LILVQAFLVSLLAFSVPAFVASLPFLLSRHVGARNSLLIVALCFLLLIPCLLLAFSLSRRFGFSIGHVGEVLYLPYLLTVAGTAAVLLLVRSLYESRLVRLRSFR
jgi:hypothetical protein